MIKQIKLKYKLWFETGEGDGILGDGQIDFLKAIETENSISGAVRKTGISYRKAWDILKRDEELLGFPLVSKIRGGSKGGRTFVTKECVDLIAFYERIHKELDQIIKKNQKKLK